MLLSALVRSDNIPALAGPLRGEVAAILAATCALLGDPTAPPGPHLAVCEPLVGAPVALVPALDAGDGPVLVRRETWPVSDGNHLSAAKPQPAAGRGRGRDAAAAMPEALLSKEQVECPRAL